MPTTIAKYYTDELVEWVRLMNFYNSEIDQFEVKLAEVIQRNTIPGIGAKVEAHQERLNAVSQKFRQLQKRIMEQEGWLKTDNTFIDNAAIKGETDEEQKQIREKIQEIEREYIDVKYGCYEFLSETLNKQNP